MKTLGLAMIVNNTDEEAKLLDRCLASVAEHVNNVYITITGENQMCEDVAKKYNAHISHFKWINDFSKARNFNFSQVKDDYIVWFDADDIIEGGEYLKKDIQKLGTDALVLDYWYDFDENGENIVKHKKTRIIPNDNTWEWRGNIHEDLFCKRDTGAIEDKRIKVSHITSGGRSKKAAQRNLDIAINGQREHPDDPKYIYDIANAKIMLGQFKEAIINFDNFIKKSGSTEEIYLARLRQGECLYNIGKLDEALTCYLYALGLRPKYPDAYFGMAKIYFEKRKLDFAEDMLLMGLNKPIPEYNMIVWNPRDYDYNPLMLLAKTYFMSAKIHKAYLVLLKMEKMFPTNLKVHEYLKEIKGIKDKLDAVDKVVKKISKTKRKKKIKKIIDTLPIEMRSHPKICYIRNINFIKEKSSGKDLVYFCGQSAEAWTPETAKTKGIGGSEEHVINLTRELVKLGWNVTVYNNCGVKEQEFDGVKYKPWWEFNTRDKQDVCILWRSPMLCDHEINADKIIVDLHDCISPEEFLPKRVAKIDKIVVKSKWQRGLFPKVPDDKFVVLDNCFDLKEYLGECKNDPKTMIYTSSPDRGLNAFLDIYEEVKKAIPDVKAIARYGWGVFDVHYSNEPDKLEWKQKLVNRLNALGLDFSRLSHDEIAEKYQEAGIWLYPSEFGEIHCITAIKAQAAGAIPITTNFAALDETVKYGFKWRSNKNYDNWCANGKFDFSLDSKKLKKQMADKIIYLMKHPEKQDKIRKEMVENTLNSYNAFDIAKQWDKIL